MARIVALFAVFALATVAPNATAAPSFNNFTAQYVCENKIGTHASSDGKHEIDPTISWNLTACDLACKDAMVQANHTGLGCCNFNAETNGCGWSETATPVPPNSASDQKYASIIDADKWQAKKAHDHYVKKDYAAADIAYQAAVASFVSTFGENHLLTKGVKQRHSIVKVLNNKTARTDLDANYPYVGYGGGHEWEGATSNTIQLDRCSDGEQNGNETGVDCGGSCTVCPVNCTFSETPCTCTPSCGSTCSCTDNITITTPAAGRGKACPGGTNRNFTGAACPVLYTNLGSGVCSTGGKRMPYCQKRVNIGCEAACSSDPKCIGYNPNTHTDYCFLFWTAGSPLTDTSWDSCNNAGQDGSMDGQDGTEGGTCFKKI